MENRRQFSFRTTGEFAGLGGGYAKHCGPTAITNLILTLRTLPGCGRGVFDGGRTGIRARAVLESVPHQMGRRNHRCAGRCLHTHGSARL